MYYDNNLDPFLKLGKSIASVSLLLEAEKFPTRAVYIESFTIKWLFFRCLGVILLHPTANASTIMDNFKDKFQKFKIKSTGENIVAYRKYGHKVKMIRTQ